MKAMMLAVAAVALAATACSEEVGSSAGNTGGGSATSWTQSTGAGGDGGIDITDEGEPLAVTVPADGKVLVDLDALALLDGEDTANAEWELAFEGYDVFTNSGVSGNGTGGAFGPLAPFTFLSDGVPEHPFILEDVTGGAFLRWYAYEGEIHALWSRFHVYGIRDGDAFYKVQILSYYGEVQGAPVSAMYQLRWAAVGDTIGDTQTIVDMDGTAGGLAGGDDDPSGCLDLGTGERLYLTVAEAQSSSDWHLCFRRDAISVNGELGGRRGVGAIDLTRLEMPDELPVETVKTKTAASELPAFDAVDLAALSDESLSYRGDRVVSAFRSSWYDSGSAPGPTEDVWLVQSSDGARSFLIFFASFEGANGDSPGTVTLRVKQVGP